MTEGSSDRRWRRRVEGLFEEALDVREADRVEWVRRRSEGEDELADDVLRLLEAHERSDGILDRAGVRPPAGEPERYGPYRIVYRLGGGGMGTVHLAVREDAFMRRVALKVIRRDAMGAEEALRRFEAERQIMASLSHPNVARLLDGGITDDGVPYLVMEYVEGLPLTTFCDRDRLTVSERLELFLRVCAAVHHAHQNLVIHRDLKPSNILVTDGREPKLLDFGIAKLRPSALGRLEQPVTLPDARALTPEYASPEQLRGEPLTTASDVFALGILLYELLTGLHPFRRASSPLGVLDEVCEGDPLPPSVVVTAGGDAGVGERAASRGASPERLRSRLRGDLDMIVLQALREEPGRRYASAEQLAGDIARHLAGEPVLACGDGRVYRLRKLVRRRRVETLAGLAVGASLLLGLGVAVRHAEEASFERDRAERALERAEASSAFLLQLFEHDGTSGTHSDSVSARALLERGLADVEALDGYPELRARLRAVLARAHWNLGDYQRAGRLFGEAVAELSGAVGGVRDEELSPEIAGLLAERADALKMSGDYVDALDAARRARDLRVLHLGSAHPLVATSLVQLGTIYVYLGDLGAADAHTRAALRLRRAVLGDDSPAVTAAMEALALVSHRRGEPDEAEELLRAVVARRRDEGGPESVEHAEALLRLARFLFSSREAPREAEALLRRALLILDPAGPEHATATAALAEAVARQGRWEEAETLYRAAIALRRSIFGGEHASVADLLAGLGEVLLAADRLEAAQRAFRESLSVWEVSLGPEHPAMAYGLSGLSRIASRRAEHDRAEVLARQALAVRRGALVPGHSLIGHSEGLLEEVLSAAGHSAPAEPAR